MGTNKNALKLLTVIISVFLTGYLLETYVAGLLGDYFEILFELFPVFVSFSIFGMTWFAYGKSRDNHDLFLGAVFLVIGFLDVFHMFSYPFLPGFSPEKAAGFYSTARLISAPLFLASAYIYKGTLPELINRPVLLVSALLLSSLVLAWGLFYPDNVAAMLYPDGSPTESRMHAVLITSLIVLYTSYTYAIRMQRTGQKNLLFLICGFIVLIVSEAVYYPYETAGHLLKIVSFFYMHFAIYKSSIEMPYEKLALAEEKLRLAAREKYRDLVENAYDAIITLDLDDTVTSWNRGAEKLFGWRAEEVIGKKFAPLIVPDNLRGERERTIIGAMSGEAITGVDTVCSHRDGHEIDVSVTYSPLRDAQDIVGLSAIIRERKRNYTSSTSSGSR